MLFFKKRKKYDKEKLENACSFCCRLMFRHFTTKSNFEETTKIQTSCLKLKKTNVKRSNLLKQFEGKKRFMKKAIIQPKCQCTSDQSQYLLPKNSLTLIIKLMENWQQ